MLVMNQVCKEFGSFVALKNITLEFENGIYGLLAPNGAGKTTLIKMLVTLLFPTKGDITYDGTDVIKLDEEYRNILGYLPQQFGYYKNYSPEKYLMYLSALKGIDKNTAKRKIPELLKLVGLEDVSGKKMKKFSGGMIQRVGIAQSMINDPKILILDEPTAGLDPKERARFRKLLTELAQNRIIILSTHIVSDVESIANEIIMIKDKQILHKDSISNICKILEGKIFETDVALSKAATFRSKYASIGERQESGQMTFRFIVEEEITHQDWKKVKPNLEDVFLHIYEDDVTLAGSMA